MWLFLFSENMRTLSTEIKVLPSVQSNEGVRNKNLYKCFAWSYTFAGNFTFLERQRSNMELSIVRMMTCSSESREDYGTFYDACRKYYDKTYPINLSHLHKAVYGILSKGEYIFASDMIIYLLLLKNIRRKRY